MAPTRGHRRNFCPALKIERVWFARWAVRFKKICPTEGRLYNPQVSAALLPFKMSGCESPWRAAVTACYNIRSLAWADKVLFEPAHWNIISKRRFSCPCEKPPSSQTHAHRSLAHFSELCRTLICAVHHALIIIILRIPLHLIHSLLKTFPEYLFNCSRTPFSIC